MSVKHIEHGHRYEDFEVGRVFKHHWGRTLTQADNTLFVSLTMHYNPMYVNAEYARKLGYESCPIQPLLVFNTALGLSVEDLSEGGGPFLGLGDVQFFRPVYSGDTLSAESEVLSRRLTASRPGWAIVSWRTRAYNQRQELVLEYQRTNLVRTRSAS